MMLLQSHVARKHCEELAHEGRRGARWLRGLQVMKSVQVSDSSRLVSARDFEFVPIRAGASSEGLGGRNAC